jgi:hypothetical protein
VLVCVCVSVFSWRVGLRVVVLVRSVGVLVCWCVSELLCWCVGVLASCCVGMLRVDVLVCWCTDHCVSLGVSVY